MGSAIHVSVLQVSTDIIRDSHVSIILSVGLAKLFWYNKVYFG